MATVAWTDSTVEFAGWQLHLSRAGTGRPALVLHHDIGTLDRLPFYDALATSYDVLVPHHPGYSRSQRPEWMRSVRDIAVIYRGLLSQLGIEKPALIGLGFGGWIAAEMASMAPRDLSGPGDRRLHRLCPCRLPRSESLRPRLRRRAVERAAGRMGHLPRDELPHRMEAIHVQPDPSGSAGRRARAGVAGVGRRR
jgi:pimeloyl-ACP methyl ester carboxylesterase